MDQDPVQKAMSNDLLKQIREAVIGFCSVEILKSCRLVSKQWMKDSVDPWRTKATLRLNWRTLQEYMELLKDPSDPLKLREKPFRNFHIDAGLFPFQNADTQMRTTENAQHLAENGCFADLFELLPRFGSLKSLKMRLDQHWPDCIHGADFNLSNLKRLKIKIIPAKDVGSEKWEYLLSCFPNIEALSIELTPFTIEEEELAQHWQANCIQLLTAIKEMRKSRGNEFIPLKELEIVDMHKNKHSKLDKQLVIRTLKECKFPMEKLTLDVIWDEQGSTIRPYPFGHLLKSYQDTLKYLKTSFHSHVDNAAFNSCYALKALSRYEMCLPMKELKEVILVDGLPWGLHLLLTLNLPKLEKLIVEHGKNKVKAKGIQLAFPMETVYETLETFEYHDSHSIPGPSTIQTFAKLMKNLVHLTIPLDKTTFQIVCREFRGLKILNILGAQCNFQELDDETLTGVPLMKGRKGQARSPNITDLALLTDLSISCGSQLQRNDVKFTDHSVTYGFLQLPRLCSLSIAFKKLSDERKAELLRHVKGNVRFQEEAIVQSDTEYSPVTVGFKKKIGAVSSSSSELVNFDFEDEFGFGRNENRIYLRDQGNE